MKRSAIYLTVLALCCAAGLARGADAGVDAETPLFTILYQSGSVFIDGQQMRTGEKVPEGSYLATGPEGRIRLGRGTKTLMAFGPKTEARLDDGLRLFKGTAVVSNTCTTPKATLAAEGDAGLCGEIYFAEQGQQSVMCLAPFGSLSMGGVQVRTGEAAACYTLSDKAPTLRKLADASQLSEMRTRISGPGRVPSMFEIAGVVSGGDESGGGAGSSGLLAVDEGGDTAQEDSASGGGESLCLEGGDAAGTSGDTGQQGIDTEIEQGYSRVIIHVVFEE